MALEQNEMSEKRIYAYIKGRKKASLTAINNAFPLIPNKRIMEMLNSLVLRKMVIKTAKNGRKMYEAHSLTLMIREEIR